jgi:hypothetical protein
VSYQPQYQYTPAPRAHHWLDLLLKVGGLLGGATAAAVMGVHMIHKYSPPTGTAPVAQIVAYYSKGGLGAAGSHWTMEASENTAQWHKAVAYCRAQAQQASDLGDSKGAPAGCATIRTLAQSGY